MAKRIKIETARSQALILFMQEYLWKARRERHTAKAIKKVLATMRIKSWRDFREDIEQDALDSSGQYPPDK